MQFIQLYINLYYYTSFYTILFILTFICSEYEKFSNQDGFWANESEVVAWDFLGRLLILYPCMQRHYSFAIHVLLHSDGLLRALKE